MPNRLITAFSCGAIRVLALAGVLALSGVAARAQSLTVLPVNITMLPGQMATTLTVINHGDAESSIQVRALRWSQSAGTETLANSDEIVASPPIATIAAGATQVVRLVLRRPATGHEASYRILVDQIPPAASPGTVRIALRLSIPVFALPPTRVLPRLSYHVELGTAEAVLVATNDGERHEKLNDVVLLGPAGRPLRLANDASPYILAGATSRRRILVAGREPSAGASMRLTGKADAGEIDQTIRVIAAH